MSSCPRWTGLSLLSVTFVAAVLLAGRGLLVTPLVSSGALSASATTEMIAGQDQAERAAAPTAITTTNARHPLAAAGPQPTEAGGPAQQPMIAPLRPLARPAPPPVGLNVAFVGQIGGASRSIAVLGAYAYVGVGRQLVVFDVTTPAAPRVVGWSTTLPGPIRAVAVAGTHAYIIVQDAGVRVLSIADPLRPMEVGSYPAVGLGRSIAVVGTTLYVANGADGLLVIDTTTPAQLRLVASYRVPGWAAEAVVADGRRVYTVGSGVLRILDVTNQSQPRQVGTLDLGKGAATGLGVLRIAGDYLYVTGYDPSIRVIDVTDPAQPAAVGAYRVPGPYPGGRALAIDPTRPVAYLTDFERLRILDLTDPALPVEVGSYPATAWEMALAGTLLHVGTEDGSLHVLDVSDPANPRRIGFHSTAARWTTSVALASPGGSEGSQSPSSRPGHYAYVTHSYSGAPGHSGLRIVDVGDPTRPVEVGALMTPDHALGIAVAGTRAYVAAGPAGLRIIDVADAARPAELGSFATRRWAKAIAIDGTYAFVADAPNAKLHQHGGGGLLVVDIADAQHPKEVAFRELPGAGPTDIAVVAHRAYVATPEGVRIFDISDPAQPVEEEGETGEPASGLVERLAHAAGRRYAVVPADDRVRVVEVAGLGELGGLQSPVEVGFYRTGDARDVATEGNLAYVATWGNGLVIVRFAPTHSADNTASP